MSEEIYKQNERLLKICKEWLGLESYECFNLEEWPAYQCSLIDSLKSRSVSSSEKASQIESLVDDIKRYADDDQELPSELDDIEGLASEIYRNEQYDVEDDLEHVRDALENLRLLLKEYLVLIKYYVPMKEEFPIEWHLCNIETWCKIEG